MNKEGTILKNLIGKRFGRLTVVGEGNLVEYGNQGKKQDNGNVNVIVAK